MRTVNFLQSKVHLKVDGSQVINLDAIQYNSLLGFYSTIKGDNLDKAMCKLVIHMIRKFPTMEPVKVIIPSMPEEAYTILKKELEKTSYTAIVLIKGEDEDGNRNYRTI